MTGAFVEHFRDWQGFFAMSSDVFLTFAKMPA
jgi:hypothetical protein